VTARPEAGLRAWVRRHDLLLYFVLAFLLSWLAWPLVALNPESSPCCRSVRSSPPPSSPH
jgi:hypothetical protein